MDTWRSESFAFIVCNKGTAAWITRCSSLLDSEQKGGCGYTEHKIEHTDRNLAYMMVARYHVATVPPLFQPAHATVHVIKVSDSARCCRISTEETVNLWPQKVRIFSACETTWSVFRVSILCLPAETAVVCNVNEAPQGCVNDFI